MKKAHRPASHLFQKTALCAALALSVFGNAQALTLSRPVVQSKQGEALRAEIDVSEITLAEQIDFQANLASLEIYRASNIELPTSNGQPLDIQVQLLRRDNGKIYLQVTSKQSIHSNALDLLIDLRWSTGRTLRDISLSIDENKAPAKANSTPTVAASPAPTVRAPQPALTESQIQVKRGDTASELTIDKMPDGASLDQMLLALLRRNPEAFVESNVNRMKAGVLLTLPTEQEVKAVSREEARRQIQVQTKDFEAYRAELAARAPGGTVAKATRDSAGSLEAQVKNSNAKRNQDKLTLSKPDPKSTAAEDKIAQQREAQDVANRAAELSRNIADLGKIAAATVAGTASEPASAELTAEVPASAASANGAWLDELLADDLTPIGAGGLVALLLLLGLWRHRVANRNDDEDIQGLPPLNVKFNLDLPEFEERNPAERAYIHDVATHEHDMHPHVPDEPEDEHHHDDEAHAPAYADSVPPPPRPTQEMPNISLDLDTPISSPYQVRIDLADELWKLGQQHTSRALMEEVANEASGADKEKALQWLAERG
jgi:FimV-like protein